HRRAVVFPCGGGRWSGSPRFGWGVRVGVSPRLCGAYPHGSPRLSNKLFVKRWFMMGVPRANPAPGRSEEHTSELQSRENLVCRLLLEKKKKTLKKIIECNY